MDEIYYPTVLKYVADNFWVVHLSFLERYRESRDVYVQEVFIKK